MKILSWNVNGFRAVVKKGFYDFLNTYKPDILGLQEIKQKQPFTKPLLFDEEYNVIWNPAEREGYAGTALFTKLIPLSSTTTLNSRHFDEEGRYIVVEYEHFYLFNVYFPNSRHNLERLDFKIKFDNLILKTAEKLRNKKPVIIMGDFNVAHQPIDLARARENEGNAGYTEKERQWFSDLLDHGYVDTFRYFHKHEVKYSWWTYRFNARARNIGWRVDYVVVTKEFLPYVKDAFILTDVLGSDHAPVGIEVEL